MEIYSKIIRKCLGILIAALTIPIISGCQLAAVPAVTAMHLANVADQASWGKRAKKIWDEEREQVRDLQARGDPMGDYLYALGNAQGWIHDTRDPLVILDLFKKAAKKGSSDAEIVVGLFYFFGIIPSKNQYTVGLPKQFRDIELGSKLIREGIKKRCAYAEPVPGNDGVYLRYVSGAGRIWHFYRDGQNDIDASGKFYPVIKPDNRLEKEWHDLDKQCKQSGATTD